MPETLTEAPENPLTPEISDAPMVENEKPEPGNGPSQDEINAARGETMMENMPKSPAVADTLAMGITKVRGLRMTALASLIAIIGPKAKELLELIAGFDPAHLQHLLVRLTQYGEIKTPVTEPAGREERTVVAGQIFEAWSRMTPGTRDDDYSNWLNRILADNALRDEFVAYVGSKIGGPPVTTFEATTKAALAAGIEGTEMLNFGETIAGVIQAMVEPYKAISP